MNHFSADEMYLSDLAHIIDFLNENATGSIINSIHRSRNGTIIKLFGKDIKGIYFNLKEKTLFPISDFSFFIKEPLSRLEEGLRSNFYGRIISFCLLEKYGKTVAIETLESSLVIPLFGKRAVRILDNSDSIKWIEWNDIHLNLLGQTMRHYPPQSDDVFFFERLFIEQSIKKEKLEKEKIIEKKKKKLFVTLKLLKNQLDKYRFDIDQLSASAVIIKSNLNLINSAERKEFIELNNFQGEIVKIAMDPSKSILENMNRFFSKVKKSKNGIIHTEKRIAEISSEIELINVFETENHTENCKYASLPEKRKKQNIHSPYHEYHTTDGRIFLVGKDAKDNDDLTFKISSPHDIWFHAKDYHGSHIILKMRKGEELSGENLLTGCILALFYSKAKKGMSGEVWYTARKNVTKKKGLSAGMVIIKNGKSKYINAGVFPDNIRKIE